MKQGLVTGAADGIGRSLARTLLAKGFSITGLDVDRERSQHTSNQLKDAFGAGRVRWILADLASDDGVAEGLAQSLGGPPLDLLVHNAGINRTARFQCCPEREWRRLLAVNLKAPLMLTAGLLKARHLKPGASIVLISSLSHYIGYPGAAVYAATKDGLASYGRSLRGLSEPRGLHVLTVFPGPTRTRQARRASPDNTREQKRMPPDELAERIWRALCARKRSLVPGLANRVAAMLGRILPRATEAAIRRAIYQNLPTDEFTDEEAERT